MNTTATPNMSVRVEKQIIKKTDPSFEMLKDFCLKSRNLYNHANYIVRQTFINSDTWVRYADLNKLLRADKQYLDYALMPNAAAAQQTLRALDADWKAFFRASEDYRKHPDKYSGRPKLPKYLDKGTGFPLYLTYQAAKLKRGGVIQFPKTFKGFVLKSRFLSRSDFYSYQQVRFLLRKDFIVIELVYQVTIPAKRVNANCMAIDLGVDNLVTACDTLGSQPFIISGKPLKSINQYYNKTLSRLKSTCKLVNKSNSSKRIRRLTTKRNRRIDDYMHKASRMLVDYCDSHDISTIVIGKNANWKQGADLGKRVNQNFVQIPFTRLIEMIQYKAEEKGIAVVPQEESYTSGTSFIDDEMPVKANYNKGRRKFRGLFVSNEGIAINADLNAAYQILRKYQASVNVAPIKWSRGCAVHPSVIDIPA